MVTSDYKTIAVRALIRRLGNVVVDLRAASADKSAKRFVSVTLEFLRLLTFHPCGGVRFDFARWFPLATALASHSASSTRHACGSTSGISLSTIADDSSESLEMRSEMDHVLTVDVVEMLDQLQ